MSMGRSRIFVSEAYPLPMSSSAMERPRRRAPSREAEQVREIGNLLVLEDLKHETLAIEIIALEEILQDVDEVLADQQGDLDVDRDI